MVSLSNPSSGDFFSLSSPLLASAAAAPGATSVVSTPITVAVGVVSVVGVVVDVVATSLVIAVVEVVESVVAVVVVLSSDAATVVEAVAESLVLIGPMASLGDPSGADSGFVDLSVAVDTLVVGSIEPVLGRLVVEGVLTGFVKI